MALFDGIFNNDPQKAAAGAQIAGLNQGYNDASGALTTGNAKTDADYASGMAPYQTNLGVTQGGQSNYADATGVNGADGYARALQSFHTAPGYDFMLDQGSQNVLRHASQGGFGGGTQVDLQKLAIGQADQSWQQYIQNLQPFIGASTANAAGVAGVNTAKAGTDTTFAGKGADLAWQKDTGIGNANANADLSEINTNGNIINGVTNFAKSLAAFVPV